MRQANTPACLIFFIMQSVIRRLLVAALAYGTMAGSSGAQSPAMTVPTGLFTPTFAGILHVSTYIQLQPCPKSVLKGRRHRVTYTTDEFRRRWFAAVDSR